MWCLYEFDGVAIPDLHPTNFQPVGSPRVRDYLTPIMDGDFIDRYQDIDGNYEDVPAARRTMSVKTLAKNEDSTKPFTRWDNLRKKSGSYGKLYRKWVKGSGQDEGGGSIVPTEMYGNQWVWARMIERPLTKYGTIKYDGSSSVSAETTKSADPVTDHTIGTQPMEFVFETAEPYWRSFSPKQKEFTPTSGDSYEFGIYYDLFDVNLQIGELAITDAKITLTGCTSFQLGIAPWVGWEITGLTAGDTYIIDSLTDRIYEEGSPNTDLYSSLSFGTTIGFTTYTHTKAPLVYIPNFQTTGYLRAVGTSPSVTFTYYISYKD